MVPVTICGVLLLLAQVQLACVAIRAGGLLYAGSRAPAEGWRCGAARSAGGWWQARTLLAQRRRWQCCSRKSSTSRGSQTGACG